MGWIGLDEVWESNLLIVGSAVIVVDAPSMSEKGPLGDHFHVRMPKRKAIVSIAAMFVDSFFGEGIPIFSSKYVVSGEKKCACQAQAAKCSYLKCPGAAFEKHIGSDKNSNDLNRARLG